MEIRLRNIPEEIHLGLKNMATEETMKLKKRVSMDSIVIRIVGEALKKKKKKK